MDSIYLDNAATTKPVDSILDAIRPYIEEHWYNPSSLYSRGVSIRNTIECVRCQIASLINAEPNEIYFTSGATEANNWVIRGFDDACGGHNVDIITTSIEHASITRAVNNPNLRSNIKLFDIDGNGVIDLNSLNHNYNGWTFLASVIAVNNEIGTIQDLKKIASVVHSNNGIFHTDATQMIPHIKVDVKEIGIDLLSASAQKLGGLKGAGFLYIKNSIKNKIAPLIYGEQEGKQRGGTENVIGIVAMGEAIKHINYKDSYHMSLVRDCIIDKLENIGCKLIGHRTNRLPNNVCVMLPSGVGAEECLYMLDLADIMISAGSACNSHSKEPSHVLKAIGLSDEEASRVIRITFCNDITIEEIDVVVNEIKKVIELSSANERSL